MTGRGREHWPCKLTVLPHACLRTLIVPLLQSQQFPSVSIVNVLCVCTERFSVCLNEISSKGNHRDKALLSRCHTGSAGLCPAVWLLRFLCNQELWTECTLKCCGIWGSGHWDRGLLKTVVYVCCVWWGWGRSDPELSSHWFKQCPLFVSCLHVLPPGDTPSQLQVNDRTAPETMALFNFIEKTLKLFCVTLLGGSTFIPGFSFHRCPSTAI